MNPKGADMGRWFHQVFQPKHMAFHRSKAALEIEPAVFEEQNGLWEEAKLLRNADKKDGERGRVRTEARGFL